MRETPGCTAALCTARPAPVQAPCKRCRPNVLVFSVATSQQGEGQQQDHSVPVSVTPSSW